MMRQWKVVRQMLRASLTIAAALMMTTLVAGAAPIPTRTVLSVATSEANGARQTKLTARVTDTTGAALNRELTLGGAMSFETAAGSLGSAFVDADGFATLNVTSVPAVPGLTVRAVYHPAELWDAGEAASLASAASASAVTVLEPAVGSVPNFALTLNPSTVMAKQGQFATTAVTVAPQNGFSEQVTLSCSSLPAQVTCNFSPVIQSTAAGAFTSTLELQTQIASGAVAAPKLGVRRGTGVALAWVLPGVLALAGFAGVRRKALQGAGWQRATVLLVLLVAGAFALGGCSQRYGYIHHPPVTAGGTPIGSYTITISASGNDGSAVTIHQQPLVLQVQ